MKRNILLPPAALALLALKMSGVLLLLLGFMYGRHVLCYHWINPQSPDARLIDALWVNDQDAIAVALADGASPNAAEDFSGWTVLMMAACRGNTGSVTYLLDHGASLHARDRNGRTALMHAAFSGKSEMARELIRLGAKVDEVDLWEMTPLSHAVINRQLTTVDALLQCGANPNVADCDGITPLMSAAEAGESASQIVTLLIEAGALPGSLDDAGDSAADYAHAAGLPDVARLIRELKIRPIG